VAEQVSAGTGYLTQLNHYRLLGNSGLRVSPLALGTMTFGMDWGWGAPQDECRKMFDHYVSLGGNFIDTSINYTNGTAEAYVGEFAKGRRDELVIATKYTLNTRRGDPNAGGTHRKNLMQSLEASLKRLQTDYIDLYFVHVWDFLSPVEEVMRALDDAVRAGKVLYIAISDAPAWKIAQANTLATLRGWTPFIGLQARYNLIDRTAERDLIPMAREFNIAVMPWAALASGALTGKHNPIAAAETNRSESLRGDWALGDSQRNRSIAEEVQRMANEIGRSPAQVAINWLMQQQGVTAPVLGARTLSQLEDNLSAIDFVLPVEHVKRLTDISETDPGFPHNFITADTLRNLVLGNAVVEPRR